ncbi:MAG: thiamine phosphate synthase [Alphaproteobacteria bacterium]|nr:thiamine phosphate synthase [Alphaproteobacteria bacterium]MDE2014094.1 thiamine phosphate synthase [Alphaproteobacteria bacterium]MDE2072219.1 thiamine phosphate synthase [Alphaproteobacteria bacterium]MDE2350688.1 thiamine phosphate synthase [Alphaproteobacteria bacterium]
MADRLSRAKLARAAAALNARAAPGGPLPPLALLTDDERSADPLAAARALPKGSLVILRARDAARRAALAQALLRVAYARDLVLLIADDPTLATNLGAHGLHLPEARAHEAVHWRASHPHWLITAAAHSLRAIQRARHADAVLLSPVFASQSHQDAPGMGAVRFRILARQARKPVYALGGVDAHTVLQLTGAPATGIAAIGALSA